MRDFFDTELGKWIGISVFIAILVVGHFVTK